MKRQRAEELTYKVLWRHSGSLADAITDAILAAAAEENEACAKVADEIADSEYAMAEQQKRDPDGGAAAQLITDIIRMRSTQ